MQIIKKPGFYVVGKKVSCPWEQLGIEMPKAWAEVTRRKHEISNKVSPYTLDICLQLKDGIFTQLVGVEVSKITEVPDGFEGISIPEQNYVHTRHTGTEMEMIHTFENMIKWAKENNHTIDPEDFKIQFAPDDKNGAHELYYKVV
ncbi:hypothetical protein CVD28_12395 [Bacillus sp. M6-12]|uniref:GyrI-like domain-containing protein n=1 Tax=Bacillus sp. M6-12 TaxID=2054166 RepID=UPI000C75D26A|nr:GyrI-like domain-containing protein [Bacillus sp. M6-12]PLS17359.1 hypothetical protein CVD28_12395 [Bacillus sp. M6-12]